MNTLTTCTPAQAIEAAELFGTVEIQSGVWLWSKDAIQAEQATWDEDDQAKACDFSGSPYWLTDDTGIKPLAIYGADDQDLIDALQ